MKLLISAFLVTFLNILLLTKGANYDVINEMPIEVMHQRFQGLIPLLRQKRGTRSTTTKVIRISPRNTGSSSTGCNMCQAAAPPACPMATPACPFANAPTDAALAAPVAAPPAATAPTIIMSSPPAAMPMMYPMLAPQVQYIPMPGPAPFPYPFPTAPAAPAPSLPSLGGGLPDLGGSLPSLGGSLPDLGGDLGLGGDLSGSLPSLDGSLDGSLADAASSLLSRRMPASSFRKSVVQARIVQPNVIYMPSAQPTSQSKLRARSQSSSFQYGSQPPNIIYVQAPPYPGQRMSG